MKNSIKILLLIIILLASFLRIYKLDQVPLALNWDEAAFGYNAYTIANWGKDEWGNSFPLVFTSFRDDKHPVIVYITAVLIKVFGLSDYSARLPTALFGVFNVWLIYLLAKQLFKKKSIALFAAFFLAVSPYNIHLSRGLWESNYALFFYMCGLYLFLRALENKPKLFPISTFSFGLSFFSVHASKIVVPPTLILLMMLNFKKVFNNKKYFIITLLSIVILIALTLSDSRILGLSRIEQTRFSNQKIMNTELYKKTHFYYAGLLEVVFIQYKLHFTPEYLFISGDQNPRNSPKKFGEFYPVDAPLLVVGLIYLLMYRSKITLIILSWLFLSPIPSSLVVGAPSGNRALFMMGSLPLIAALGAGSILSWFKGKLKLVVLVVMIILLSTQVFSFLNYYFNVYPKKDPHDWQYGMKQIVEFVKINPDYTQVYMTDIRSQPYIFFLFYLKTALPEFLNSVVYNRLTESKSYNTVSYFEGSYLTQEGQRKRVNFYFGGWDPVESMPSPGVLYIVSSSQYDGLRYRSLFDVKKIIYYPDGGTAFYLVSSI
ncbi:MAG: glycosyltransferase family 39 protein [Candidatus Daviesbacteria bacterium]|nr:glycosyltransferase family 39 protein [Candidatus Daviesbacteria bacterium]